MSEYGSTGSGATFVDTTKWGAATTLRATAEAAREKDVPVALNRLQNTLDQQRKLLAESRDRLAPVVRAAGVAGQSGASAPVPSGPCPLATSLDTLADQFLDICAGWSELLSRLEV